MHRFRGTLWMVLTIGLLGVSAPVLAEDKEVCTTDKDGNKNCFVFRCLPSENNTLSTVVVPDNGICKRPQAFASGLTDRKDVVNALANACAETGWRLRDGGSIVTCAPTAVAAGGGASSVATAVAEGSQPLTVHVSRSVAAELDALLDKQSFSRETSSLLVQLVHQGSGPFHGFKQSGGWCWNDDGTFYGSVPCPKEAKRSDVGREKR